MKETELWFMCDVCGDEIIINQGEEFNDYEAEECNFCRNGTYGEMTIWRKGKLIK